ncbi:MAG: PQQ-binding-like beta-propeller repeat protein [Acidobacteria bacterium]|nr:PQQ-binding-like beta-propeller repeat protein [Acidobacteriota bacterium]
MIVPLSVIALAVAAHRATDAQRARFVPVTDEVLRERPKDARTGDLNRNLALYQDKVLVATSDAHLVALDARTGRPVWDVIVADSRRGIRYTSGPIAGDGRVFAGLTCGGPNLARCFVSAHDAITGKELWRRESVAGPGDPPAHNATWNGLPYERRIKASLWMTGSYDPDLRRS